MRPILLINGEWMRGAEITSTNIHLDSDVQTRPHGEVFFIRSGGPLFMTEGVAGFIETKTRRSGRRMISVHFDEVQ